VAGGYDFGGLSNSSGSLVMLRAIRRASSRVSRFHVVDKNREVTVVFKPADPSGKATTDEVVKADVVKIDVQRDLALLRPRSLPNRTVRPLQISSQDIEVGADVRATDIQMERTGRTLKASSVRSDLITNGQEVLAIPIARP
jgi:S1-C subfamily serine protease